MPTDPERASHGVRSDYWDIPEIACLLRLVTHLNFGATLALVLWLLTATLGERGIAALPAKDSVQAQPVCQCEMRLQPIPQGRRQLAQGQEPVQSRSIAKML